jgi:hypothetical protein
MRGKLHGTGGAEWWEMAGDDGVAVGAYTAASKKGALNIGESGDTGGTYRSDSNILPER